MKLTIFTPTYNRGGQLLDLYNSIANQEDINVFKNDIEWLIIDDGSIDDTRKIVNGLIERKEIKIRYFFKSNGGKHTAHNYAVDKACGDFFMICDSDDVLTPNSIKIVLATINEIDKCEKIAGMVGYLHAQSEDGTINNINKKFPKGVTESKLNDLFKIEGVFDTCQVYRTSILKEFKYPEYLGERFFPDNWCWRSIDKQYLVKVIPEVLETGTYQSDGLSIGTGSNSAKPYKNPNSNADYAYLYYETLSSPIKRLAYYGKYLVFKKYGKQSRHDEWILLNFLSLPFQIYFDKKYFSKNQK